MDTTDFKQRLEGEKARLMAELGRDGSKDPITGEWQGASAGLETEQAADPNVAADQVEELVNNESIVENLEARLREVDAALAKIADGTYGTCENCGKAIAPERLEANPAAATCTECAAA
ncbi:MAG TPA: TraR/DksA C4-type zinc finger protein [Candidatus Paceibacterota bacterium]|nr:TraR/DksA C4-type zinc finger protein [Candidatus Paceibacterota bacterium]